MSSSSDVNNWFYESVVLSRIRKRSCLSIRFGFSNQHVHTPRYDMAQSAGFSKNPLNIIPFCEKASAEPPLEWSKQAAIFEMTAFAKDGIEIRNLLRAKPPLIEPAEPIYEIKTTGETEAQKKNRDVRNQEKRVCWENRVQKAREKEFCATCSVGTRRT